MVERIQRRFEKDHPEPYQCEVQGHIPSWIKGSLYRNGPGLYQFGGDQLNHLFDGMACVHQWKFDNMKVTYRNRLLNTNCLEKNRAANRLVVSEFGTAAFPDPCKNIFHRYFSYYFGSEEQSDNTNVNVMFAGDALYAITDPNKLTRIDPDDLSHISRGSYPEKISVNMATAHPHTDTDGTVFVTGSWFGGRGNPGSYAIFKVPPTDEDCDPLHKTEILAKIPFRWKFHPSYSHSFPMTENYVVYIEQALTFSIPTLMFRKFTSASIEDAFAFYPNEKSMFHVMEKATGKVSDIKYTTEAFFTFHQVNAYEDNGHLVIDFCGYKDDSPIYEAYLKSMRPPEEGGLETFFESALYRVVLPLNIPEDEEVGKNMVMLPYTTAEAKLCEDGTVHCTPELFREASYELPQINYKRYNGKKYRYSYGLKFTNGNKANRILKVDMKDKAVTFWDDHIDYFVTEPVFVEKPGATEEDDGVLLVPSISRHDEDPSALVVLDAKSMTEMGRATIKSDIRLTFSFHGLFKSA